MCAIAISLLVYRYCLITAIDVCPEALKVAIKNANTHKVENKIVFYLGNLFDPIDKYEEHMAYDFIVSNPPYTKI